MKNLYSFLLLTFLLVMLTGCADSNGGLKKYVVNQMLVSTQSSPIKLFEQNSWEPVGITFVLINTSETSDLNCLFVAEAVGNTAFSGTESNPIFNVLPLEVRILIDDEIAFPNSASFVPAYRLVGGSTFLSSHSFLAVMKDVPAGAHSILVEWRATGTNFPVEELPRMGSRTLTVWQTIEITTKDEIPSVVIDSTSTGTIEQ